MSRDSDTTLPGWSAPTPTTTQNVDLSKLTSAQLQYLQTIAAQNAAADAGQKNQGVSGWNAPSTVQGVANADASLAGFGNLQTYLNGILANQAKGAATQGRTVTQSDQTAVAVSNQLSKMSSAQAAQTRSDLSNGVLEATPSGIIANPNWGGKNGFDRAMEGLSTAVLAAGTGELLAPVGAAAAGSVGLTGTAATIAGGAIAGAGTGAITSGLQGQNIGKGALTGAIGGGLSAAATPAATGLSSSTGLSPTLSSGIVKGAIGAGTGALNGALTGTSIGRGALTGGVAGAVSSLASSGAKSLGASNGISNAVGKEAGSLASGAAGTLVSGAPTTSAPVKSPTASIGTLGAAGALGAGLLSSGASGQGNIGNMALNPQTYGTTSGPAIAPTASTDSTLAGTIGSLLPGVIQTGAGIYGAQNAAEAMTNADNNAIATQQSTLGNINNIWGTQQKLGQGADTALGSALGTNGQPANYSNFYNMPGYQFAVQQGTQAIQRQAAAMGNAYTPNTAAAVGQYVTGTAAQDYNTYINQLMGAAGLGSTANQGIATPTYQTGANISTLQQNQGYAQASGVSGSANAVAGAFSPNGVGTSLIGAAGKYLGAGSASGTGSSGGSMSSLGNINGSGGGLYQGPLSQNDTGVGNGTFGSGVDPSTGQPWVTDNTINSGFDPNSVQAPTFDTTGSTDFGGGIDYGSNDATDFLGF